MTLALQAPGRADRTAAWRAAEWIAAAAFLALYARGVSLILLGSPADWVDLLTDDAYYYLGVARGLVEAGASSFLPPFETNGYQPLWTALLAASAWVFGTSDRALALQAFSLSYGFVAAFAWLARRLHGWAFPALASAAAFSGVALEGMETAMLPLFLLAFLQARSAPARGVWGSLLFLTRLDALALVLARDLWRLLTRRERQWGHWVIVLPVVAAYFGANQALFGVPVPVSGLAKAIGSVPGENWGVLYLHARVLADSALVAAVLATLVLLVHRRAALPFGEPLAILLLALAAVCAYYTLRSGWLPWPWYHWPQMMVFFYLAAGAAQFLSNDARVAALDTPVRLLAGAALVAAFAHALVPAGRYALTVLHHAPGSGNRLGTAGEKNAELAQWIRAGALPAPGALAMGDRAGSLGFLLGREYRFLQTEGLVGPVAYYRSMRLGAGEQFLAAHGVRYLVAERDRFFEQDGLTGVVEPVQPLSSRSGQYLLCFPAHAIVIDQSYVNWRGAFSRRHVFDVEARVPCPPQMQARFEQLRGIYGGLRRYMLHSEYVARRGALGELLSRVHPVPDLR